MNFIEELRWRGMLHDMTPGLEEVLNNQRVVGYIGFDPTAPSLTIGNYVQVMILKLFQKYKHQPIILLGGATGRIGDPSGKDQERQLKSYDELDKNTAAQVAQFEKMIDFEGDNKAILFNNYEIYKEIAVLDFLRDVGKTITINYMLSKDSVKNRMDSGMSYTEFSYQLLQGYDFQYLYSKFDCILQMGGSDQWGNITSGTEFIRRNLGEKAYAVTTPLLTKADGSKFGKSTEGNIWLSPDLTSPYKFYQFWLNADDRDIEKFLKYFSLKSHEEIQSLIDQIENNPQEVKRELAKELTIRIHSQEAFDAVLNVTQLLFNNKIDLDFLLALGNEDWKAIEEEIPSFDVSTSISSDSTTLLDLIVGEERVFASNGEYRRAIKGNALSINKQKVKSHDIVVQKADWLADRYLLIENGKKNKYLVSKS